MPERRSICRTLVTTMAARKQANDALCREKRKPRAQREARHNTLATAGRARGWLRAALTMYGVFAPAFAAKERRRSLLPGRGRPFSTPQDFFGFVH